MICVIFKRDKQDKLKIAVWKHKLLDMLKLSSRFLQFSQYLITIPPEMCKRPQAMPDYSLKNGIFEGNSDPKHCAGTIKGIAYMGAKQETLQAM